MGIFDVFRKKKSGEKSAQTKPGSQKKREAEKGKKIAKIKGWGKLSWWKKLLTILGGVGIGFAIWFAVQPSAPTPSYTLSVAVAPSGSGNVSPSYGSYTDGTQVTLTATPLSGYEFVTWSGDASGTSRGVTLTMDSDKNVIANFRLIEYTLATSVSPSGGGRISPSRGTYPSGSSVPLKATPSSGYEFVSWSGDASGISRGVTLSMDSDKSVIANFRLIEYTLATSVSPPGGGRISPSRGTYPSGSSVPLKATALSGYEFVSWSGDASGTSPGVTLTMDSNKNVIANFTTIRQKVTYTMSTGISGSVAVYTNELKRGDNVDGFVELTGEYRSQDWSFRWTFEILGPEGRQIEYWGGGHWVKRPHHDFSFTAPYNGTYKIRVRHDSSYDKYLVIEIRPKGWLLKGP